MAQDKRYKAVKELILSGKIKRFKDIFEHLPKDVLAKDLEYIVPGLNKKISHPERHSLQILNEKIDNPEKLTAADIFAISILIGISAVAFFSIIKSDLPEDLLKEMQDLWNAPYG